VFIVIFYTHIYYYKMIRKNNDNICRNFQNGKCNRGLSCLFAHTKREDNTYQVSRGSLLRSNETSGQKYFNDVINDRKNEWNFLKK
jgi:hypothetical protein